MEKSKQFLELCEKYDVDADEVPEIMSFEDACHALKLDPIHVPVVDALPEKHREAVISNYKMIIIAEALNEGWEPDWSDDDQRKYFPWFEVKADDKNRSGSGLSFYGFAYWYSITNVGSRLCFSSRDRAIFAGKHFTSLYEKFFLINK